LASLAYTRIQQLSLGLQRILRPSVESVEEVPDMIKTNAYAVEVIPAALFAAPAVPAAAVLGTTVDASWKATAHRDRVVSTGMKDAFIGQTRPPRGTPL
jgi:hypothetical protein